MNMTFQSLKTAYANGELTPAALMADIRQRSGKYTDRNIWIHLLTEKEQAPYLQALASKKPDDCPLWGIPFAIKDNIDLAGIPTTAGCPEFAYTPEQSATVVQQLIDAGAIPVGKTNLDQFATGLNGTRSPYGECRNAFDPDDISGGSSSGSAVSVALGLASFSLGTDTAGSGRVPACFNNLVGVKPSIGLLSSTGLVPACRSLDCITLFAYNSDDANLALSVAEGFDPADGYSRKNPFSNQSRHYGLASEPLKVGVIKPEQLKFFGDDSYQQAYTETLAKLAQQGFELVEFDYQPFDEAALLLYEGPWVSERYLAIENLMETNPDAVHPVVRGIVEGGKTPLATSLFKAQYRLEELRQVCVNSLKQFDCVLTPTAGRLFTIEEMLAEPVLHNSQLGYYTNFMNLLDMASVAVPTAFTPEAKPFGVTLVSTTFSDRKLLSIANRIQQALPLNAGASDSPAISTELNQGNSTPVQHKDTIDVVVCGAHLDGLPLNWQLRERGATLKQATQSAPCYTLHALAGGPPFRPGMVLDETNGRAIEVEVWSVPAEHFGSFVAGIPAPLGIGKVRLADGSQCSGFICEPYGIDGAENVTEFGGWRAYMQYKNSQN